MSDMGVAIRLPSAVVPKPRNVKSVETESSIGAGSCVGFCMNILHGLQCQFRMEHMRRQRLLDSQ